MTGNWPAGDVVGEDCEWFIQPGIDTDQSPADAERALRMALRERSGH